MFYETLRYFDQRADFNAHASLVTIGYIERILESVFNTITLVAIYEIVKETMRRIEVLRLRSKANRYKVVYTHYRSQVTGCQDCPGCYQANTACITYRAVPRPIFDALKNKTWVYKTQPICRTRPYFLPQTSQDEINQLASSINEMGMFLREIYVEQNYGLRKNLLQNEAVMRRRRAALMLSTLREQRSCACTLSRSTPSPRTRPPQRFLPFC